MAYQFPPDVKQLVAERMASGDYGSEDDLLRDALAALAEAEEDLQAVRDAVADFRAGDEGVSLDEAFTALRSDRAVAPER